MHGLRAAVELASVGAANHPGPRSWAPLAARVQAAHLRPPPPLDLNCPQALPGGAAKPWKPYALVAHRLRASIRHNLTYYLSIGAAGLLGVLLLLVSGQLSWGDLLPLAMLLSNTYGALPRPRPGAPSGQHAQRVGACARERSHWVLARERHVRPLITAAGRGHMKRGIKNSGSVCRAGGPCRAWCVWHLAGMRPRHGSAHRTRPGQTGGRQAGARRRGQRAPCADGRAPGGAQAWSRSCC